MFGRGWTWAGRVDQVANNGNYLVGATGTVKYVVVRGEDGVLRAFHNACRCVRFFLFQELIRTGNLSDGTCVLCNSYRHHAMEVASAPGDVPGSNPTSADMSTKCESTPSAKCFQCPYHGWTYDLEGSLIRATKIGKFILIIIRAIRLTSCFVYVYRRRREFRSRRQRSKAHTSRDVGPVRHAQLERERRRRRRRRVIDPWSG